MSLIIFFIILSFLVLIHELGHFLAAKKNGVMVEEFGFGLPPRIFGKKIGETIYSINLLPIGGFVKLFGEEQYELEKNKKINKNLKSIAFIYKKPWQKTIIILAGVFMNLIVGITIFYITLSLNNFKSTPIPMIIDNKFTFGKEIKKVIIANINKNSPAQKAGVKNEDVVLGYKINGGNWQEINSSQEFINIVKNTKNQPISFNLLNNKNGQKKVVTVIPVYNSNLKRYIIGVNLMDVVILSYQDGFSKIFSGIFHSYNLLDYNLKVFGHLFSTAIKEKNPSTITESLTGPVGIFAVVDDTVKKSGQKTLINLLELSGLISLSLALMNVMPFPALDGGRLIFVIYEWITGRPSNKEIEKYFNFIGFLILISLAILISINDLAKFFR
ncbi:MAG: RIP metalloprotease RseP [Candidatus Microgenomates bacterium]